MRFGPITAVRVFQNLKNLISFTAGKSNRVWFEEQFSSINAPELPPLVDTFDRQAAVDQDSRIRQEHIDAYCISRDNYYATRSRKWLYTNAMANRVEQNYAVWLSFIRENGNMGVNLQQFLKVDPDTLATQTPAQLLSLTDPV